MDLDTGSVRCNVTTPSHRSGCAPCSSTGSGPGHSELDLRPSGHESEVGAQCSRDCILEARSCTLGTPYQADRPDRKPGHHPRTWHELDSFGSTAGRRRGCGAGVSRGCRGAGPNAKARAVRRSLQSAKLGGCSSGVEGHGSEEGRTSQTQGQRPPKEEKERGQEKEEKEEAWQLKQFRWQPIKIEPGQFKQQQQELFWDSPMATSGKRPQGELRAAARSGWAEIQTERGASSVCEQAPRSFDRAFSGIHLQSTLQGQVGTKFTAQGIQCGGLGSPALGLDRSPGCARSLDFSRGDGLCEPQRDREGYGHPCSKDSSNSTGEEERRKLGESRMHRAHPLRNSIGQQQHAGSHQLGVKFRRAINRWKASNGGLQAADQYFCMIFSALEQVFGHSNSVFSYGAWLWESAKGQAGLRRRAEFSKVFLQHQEKGCSLPHVFPLPPFCKAGRVVEYFMGGLRFDEHTLTARGVNLVQSVLNMLHGGQFVRHSYITAAHQRIHERLKTGVEAMMVDFDLVDENSIHEFLKHRQHYAGGGPAIPLGNRGGVPASAATVDLEEHLRSLQPDLAAQVREPKLLLLPSRQRPVRLKKGHTWLHSSYDQLVRRNVRAGLHTLKKLKQVAKHRGQLCLAGAFAVPKDEVEDRVITDPSVNQLLDPEKLPRPRFAYIPKLRVTYVPRSGRLLISKRDARHYFHSLKIGRKWQRWLCGPPIGSGSALRFPASRTAPMGFGPSAGWAQGLTDVTTLAAGMPEDRRLHPDRLAPLDMPIWGSICDDIWAVDHVQTEAVRTELNGTCWLSRAEAAWVERGVCPNQKKTVDGKGGEEIQGYFVDPDAHWVGVSMKKRHLLFQATWYILQKHVVLVGDVDRLVGKYGFVHSCRPIMRSVFVEVYSWLDNLRTKKVRAIVLPDVIWLELMTAALLLPFAQFDMSSEYSQRVECSDASMSGIGRAWTTMPTEVVHLMSQLSDHPGLYTNLTLPCGIALTEAHKCPLRKLQLPRRKFHWHKAGAPASPSFIFLGEADAATWVAEDRLRRASDDGRRFVHPMDSASCVGAFNKGRSASRLLNMRCQRLCAIGVSGGHEVFYPWLPSQDNPADEPSRYFEAGTQRVEKPLEPACAEMTFLDPFTLRDWTGNERYFVHLCSGLQRPDDLIAWVERFSHDHGIHLKGIRVDLAVTADSFLGFQCSDMLQADHMLPLLKLIHAGRVLGGFVSPPHTTFTAVRRKPFTRSVWGPRPLRSRAEPWFPLPGCTLKERLLVDIGSSLALVGIGLLGEIRCFGGWLGQEHPADRGRKPFPSIFFSAEMEQLKRHFKLRYYTTDQCMFGAASKRPTGLLLPWGSDEVVRKCNHMHPNIFLQGGHVPNPHILSTTNEKFPSNFCQTLASLFVGRLLRAREHGYLQPYAPRYLGSTSLGVDPWTGQVGTAWCWPSPCPGFLTQCIKRCNKSEI